MKIDFIVAGVLLRHTWSQYAQAKKNNTRELMPFKFGIISNPHHLDWSYADIYDNINPNMTQLGYQSATIRCMIELVEPLQQMILQKDDFDVEIIIKSTDTNQAGSRYAVDAISDAVRAGASPSFTGNKFAKQYQTAVSLYNELDNALDHLDIQYEPVERKMIGELERHILRANISKPREERMLEELVIFD